MRCPRRAPSPSRRPSPGIGRSTRRSRSVEWGILTNGRLWRLYHRETAHKLDRFYEVDLPALLATGGEPFLYFYALFRREAFDARPLGVGDILRTSVEYARAVGESLKTQV